MAVVFFPKIERRDNYSTKANGDNYVDYHHYAEEVAEDCQQRCVYCDITLTEDGGEGMQLDHFRPQKHFPELGSDPYNLVLSCANCNRLKSAHWPIKDGDNSHDGSAGFVDPFEEDRMTVFNVSIAGSVETIKGPAEYEIKLLHLNRPSRVAVRQRRHHQEHLRVLGANLAKRMESLHTAMVARSVSYEDATVCFGRLRKLQDRLLALQ